jgi:hypothetical protein
MDLPAKVNVDVKPVVRDSWRRCRPALLGTPRRIAASATEGCLQELINECRRQAHVDEIDHVKLSGGERTKVLRLRRHGATCRYVSVCASLCSAASPTSLGWTRAKSRPLSLAETSL